MAKKHIIYFSGSHFAVDSITAATQAVALLAKFQPVKRIYTNDMDTSHFEPETRYASLYEINLIPNQEFRDPTKAKPEKAKKTLTLPAPKRGTIRCICEKSDVAPHQSCPHCGRPFSESHNRIHQDKPTIPGTTLRLI